jgi:hypothetical protein
MAHDEPQCVDIDTESGLLYKNRPSLADHTKTVSEKDKWGYASVTNLEIGEPVTAAYFTVSG